MRISNKNKQIMLKLMDALKVSEAFIEEDTHFSKDGVLDIINSALDEADYLFAKPLSNDQ